MDKLLDNEYRKQRIENMQKLEDLGYTPFNESFNRTAKLEKLYNDFKIGNSVSACGRIVTIRKMGKMAFAHLNDGSKKFQLMIKKDVVGENAFSAFRLLDIGDIIGVNGNYFLTKTEEKTISVDDWTLLSKALLPFPEKFHGLSDQETRYRQRSLDLISNSNVVNVFRNRTKIIKVIRKYLDTNEFMEVETPMLQYIAGGASAKPFKSHYNALNTDVYMRIAPELYLKRLIVGGLDRIYEINRNFRNEGIDKTHNPEFTCLEIYQAYGDMRTMQVLIKEMILKIAEDVFSKFNFEWMGHEIDFKKPWKEITYSNLIKKHLGDDWFDKDISTILNIAKEKDLEVNDKMNHKEITHEIYDKVIESTLIEPTFVTELPSELVPLAKYTARDTNFVDVFELIIGGKEIAPAYSELNNPIEQRLRLESQAKKNASELDEDFLTALEYGMPPTGGMGIGIDRLIMLFTGAESIRDVILFPQLKPKK